MKRSSSEGKVVEIGIKNSCETLLNETEKKILDDYVDTIIEKSNIIRSKIDSDKKRIFDKFLPLSANCDPLQFDLELLKSFDDSKTISLKDAQSEPYIFLTNLNKILNSDSIYFSDMPFRYLVDGKLSAIPSKETINDKIKEAQDFLTLNFIKKAQISQPSNSISSTTTVELDNSKNKMAKF